MSKERIAVIGAGNLGQAIAGHFALEGHIVSIQNRSHSKIDDINSQGGIQLNGALDGFARVETASYNFEDVVPGRNMVMITVPASSHADIALNIGTYLEPGQLVMLHPGHTFGAFEFKSTLTKMGIDTPITIGEIQTSLLTCRLTGPAEVFVSGIKSNIPISIFPAKDGFSKAKLLFQIYPSSIRAPNVLKTSLDNLNAIVHPPVTLLNTGRIDSGEAFLYYWQGFTPAVSSIVEALDAERFRLAEALDTSPITVQEFFSSAYPTEGKKLWQQVQSNEAYRSITAPKSMKTRLILEDLPTGLVPYSSLGQEFNIRTPLCDSFIEIANAMINTDFRKEGRTLNNLGLAGLGVQGIREFADTGLKQKRKTGG
ncbi:MAG: NAD/NADP octopine/nopaline dehydrogenase family protein [Desulfobacterales bacterium]|jgi:opine dehydrogenase